MTYFLTKSCKPYHIKNNTRALSTILLEKYVMFCQILAVFDRGRGAILPIISHYMGIISIPLMFSLCYSIISVK